MTFSLSTRSDTVMSVTTRQWTPNRTQRSLTPHLRGWRRRWPISIKNRFRFRAKIKTTGPTSHGFPVFVVWRTVNGVRKGRVVVDIRGLNKITKPDAYPMPLQSDIASAVQGCKFISVMDCTRFFHQWPLQEVDRHKLIVVSHRGSEQFNVAVMGFRN